MSRKATEDLSRRPIKELVQSVTVGDKKFPFVKFFGLSPEAKLMITSFTRLADSVLLRQLWVENGRKALTKIEQREEPKKFLSIEDIVECVWTPSKEELQRLKQRFLSGDISFKEVDRLLKVFNQRYADLGKELRLIISNQNGAQAHNLDEVINQHIEKIQKYNELHNCIKAAEIIQNFKIALGLKGDFRDVEVLYNQVCST